MPSSIVARSWVAILLIYFLFVCATKAEVYDANMWKQSSLYFLLTDRFNNPAVGTEPCAASNSYCGGTWKGIKDKIPYIKGLNFASLWVSPHCVNAPQGYHGYWPIDLYTPNPYFGTQQDMATLFNALSDNSIAVILDVVLNHMGYGSTYPSFQYYMTPFNQDYYYHNCSECPDAQCNANQQLPDKMTPLNWQQLLKCQLASLPDLDHAVPFVADEFFNWIQYLKDNFNIHGLRYDAASFIDPLFLRKFAQKAQLFGLEEIWLTQTTLGQYDVIKTHLKAGNTLLPNVTTTTTTTTPAGIAHTENDTTTPLFSTLDFPYAFALRDCFAGESPSQGCRRISSVSEQYRIMGADQSLMGRFFDNHDMARFLTLNPDVTALKNAMAVLILGQGIPIIYQGTEQGMGITPAPGFGEREPVWTTGFSTSGDLYILTRMLNWYRSLLRLWETEMTELYVDDTTYIFSRENRVIVVATNGNGTASSYTLKGLPSNSEFCNVATEGTSYCVTTLNDGSVTISAPEGGQPLILVDPSWKRSWTFFIPYNHLETDWKTGLIITFAVVPGAAIIGWLLFHLARKQSFDGFMKFTDADALGIGEDERTLKSMRTLKMERGDTLPPMDRMSRRRERENIEDEETCRPLNKSFKENGVYSTNNTSDVRLQEGEGKLASSFIVPPMLMSSLRGVSSSGASPTALYAAALQADPNLVWHLTLEYSVPHLGHGSDLMFGGLGKVVDMFGEFSTKPMAVCAPMYAPFYNDDGSLRENSLGNTSQFLAAVPIPAGSDTFIVDIYIAVPDEPSPRIFYFLLSCPQIFGRKTRGTIYTFDSEKDQMQFFSVYNQAVAFAIKSFGVERVQMHDNHAALSLQYLSPMSRPLVLAVLHNGDYDTKFKLGTPKRDAYIYQQLNLPMDSATRLSCEHLGAVDFLYILVSHLKESQCGLGFVAVSPRYALRCFNKFSLFWSLPRQNFIGILNGMHEAERVRAPPDDFEAFFEEKTRAKEAFQRRVGLEVGRDKLLMVFFGRITHQKGCDLIALAAPGILRSNPKAQIVVGGPIGDRNGAHTALKLQEVAEKFPGRVHNAAGTYIMGLEKEELILATDFFFSPSRFEPCGLADIEMGWMGAVQIGHNTGGLGKMPGFYFEGGLDNIADLSVRLEATAKKALAAPLETLQKMSIQAIKSEFPPEEMIAKYDVEWAELAAARTKAAAHAAPLLNAMESTFFEDAWRVDNTFWKPDDIAADTEKSKKIAKDERTSAMRAWWSNAMLILAQSFFQAPALLAMLWAEYILQAGTIQAPLYKSQTMNTMTMLLLIKFAINIVSAPIWQWLAACMSPRNYIYLSAGSNVFSWLCTLWGLLAPSTALVLYMISCCLANSPIPIIGLIFLNVEGKVPVSQYGIPLMGLSDMFRYLIIFIVATQRANLVEWSIPTMIGVRCLFLVLSIWLLMYFVAPGSLPPHFTYYRLKFKGQVEILLKQRKAWIFFTLTCFCDAFAITLVMASIFKYYESETSIVYWSYNALSLSAVVYIGLVCLIFTSKAGIRLGIPLYYALALLPGQALAQILLVVYGKSAAAPILACTVLNFAVVRYSVVGILNLHTMPSRETTSLVTSLQLIVGSVAVGVGTIAGWKLNASEAWLWVTLAAVVEAVRLVVALAFIKLHKKENLATP